MSERDKGTFGKCGGRAEGVLSRRAVVGSSGLAVLGLLTVRQETVLVLNGLLD